MHTLFFGNGPIAVSVLRWLKKQPDQSIAGLVVHEPNKRIAGPELIEASGLPNERIFIANTLGSEKTLRAIQDLQPFNGLSVLFGTILQASLLDLFPGGVFNIHPGLLPFNRGRSAQVWGIIEKTPVGATLHKMDTGVDTGPIVHRIQVPITATDTGATLRNRIEKACVEVAKAGWPLILQGIADPVTQDTSTGTTHKISDLSRISEISLDEHVRTRDLIDKLRALTSPPQSKGAYFTLDGRRVRITVHLEEDPPTSDLEEK